MVTIKNIILLATSASAAVLRRDAAKVMSDLQTINSDVKALTTAANGFNGQILSALPIENAESTLDSDIKSATTDTNNSAAVGDADAQAIIDYINNTLEPSISTSIAAITSKKAQFSSAGISGIVTSDLNTLQTDTDALGKALVSKAPADKQSAAQSALAKIDADFKGALAAFSS